MRNSVQEIINETTGQKERRLKIRSHTRKLGFKDPDHPDGRFKVRGANKVRIQARKELLDPQTIYILGGRPFYVHSSIEYFKIGFNTAKSDMSAKLYNLWQSRVKVLTAYADQIDQRWKEGFIKMFNDPYMSFADFRDIWNNSIAANQDPNSVFEHMRRLAAFKGAKTKVAYYENLQSDFRKRIQTAFAKKDEETLAAIQAQANKMGIEFSISTNGKISWGGIAAQKAKEWEKSIKASTQYYVNLIKEEAEREVNGDKYKRLLNTITTAHKTKVVKEASKGAYETYEEFVKAVKNKNVSKAMKKVVDQALKTNTEITNISHLAIGFLTELGFEQTMGPLLTNLDAAIENIGTQQSNSESATTADTKITSPNFTIYLSDKSSESADYGSLDKNMNFNWYDVDTVDQFHAPLSTSPDNFIELKVETNRAAEFDNIAKLCNYVTANASTFRGARNGVGKESYQEFKKLVLAYAAWLRLSKAILGLPGDTIAEDTPIGIRTLKSIYNIADLLRFFINLTSPELINAVLEKNKSYGSEKVDFLDYDEGLNALDKAILFEYKVGEIQRIADENPNTINISPLINYKEVLRTNRVINDFLNSFWGGRSFAGIKRSYVVKLRNLTSTWEGA